MDEQDSHPVASYREQPSFGKPSADPMLSSPAAIELQDARTTTAAAETREDLATRNERRYIEVDWEKPRDPHNPMDWSPKRKWLCVALVSLVTFNTSLSTTIFTPSAPLLMEELHSDNAQLASLSTSIFIVSFVFGPLIFAPLSEIYGRSVCFHATGVLFEVFTVACAASTTMPMILAFRFFQGLWGCVPTVIGGGVIADLVGPENRAKALSGWMLGPLLGPVIGPVAGGFIAQYLGWRWSFWIVAIIHGALIIASLIFLQESYAPVLLERKAERMRRETGNLNIRSKLDQGKPPSEIMRKALVRPLKLLFRSPIIIMLALTVSIFYGYMYLIFTTFTTVFEGQYGFSSGASGLSYLGLGVGFIAGLVFTGIVSDRLTAQMTRGNGMLKPEYRLAPLATGVLSVPIGLFWYGWTTQYKLHWIVPIFGTVLIGFGAISVYMPIQAYLIDAFTIYAASAGATNTVVRSIFGALLPLAGPSLYNNLGLGWGNSVLAFIALVTFPIPFLLLRHGERIRTSPRFRLDL
ncbi:fluconazole resistance protein 1 [Hypoxylon sp. FL1150]|nr:fluconazole resistance protein 1 [Hypoxylon sp. FL1150]